MSDKVALPKISSLIGSSFSFVGKNWKEMFFIVGLPLGLQELLSYVNILIASNFGIGSGHAPILILWSLVGPLLSLILAIFFLYSIAVSVLYIKNFFGGVKSMGKAYSAGFRYFFPYLWILILTDLCFYGASLVFILPGIAVFVYLQSSSFLVLDDKYRGLAALSASFQLVKGNWWRVFGRMIILPISNVIFIVFLSAVALMSFHSLTHSGLSLFAYAKNNLNIISLAFILASWVYSIFAMPYSWVLYKSLLKEKESRLTQETLGQSKGFFLGLSIWGLVGGFFITIAIFASIVLAALSAARQQELSLPNAASTVSISEEDMIDHDLAANMLSYSDPAYGFSLNYPADWDVVPSTTTAPYSIFFIAPAEAGASADNLGLRGSVVVNVNSMKSPYTLSETDQAYESSVAYEASTLNDQWTILSKQSVVFQGFPAYKYATTKLRTFDNGVTYVTQKSETYVFPDGNLIYDVEYKNDLNDFDLAQPLGDQIMSTLKIK